MSSPDRGVAVETATEFWSSEYWAKKQSAAGEVSLYLFRKRLSAPKANEAPLPVLFLVHGSSMSSRSTFDLATPGHGDYSLMNTFAKYGFDVWTMDHEGYGHSSRTTGNSDIASGVADLEAGVELVLRETGQQKVHFFGESSGALRATGFAIAHPEQCGRIALSAFTYKGDGSPTLNERAKQLEYFRTHNTRLRDRKLIRSIFTRDQPGTTDPAIGEFLADEELKFGDQVPTGTYLDMTANLPVVDPTKVQVPVLLLRGEYDGIASVDDLSEFFRLLPNGNRQFVILPATAHTVVLSLNREFFWKVLYDFLSLPEPKPLLV